MEKLTSFISFIEQKKAAIFIGAGISHIAGCSELEEICRTIIELKIVQEQIKTQNPKDVPRKLLFEFFQRICKKSDSNRRKYEGIMRKSLNFDPDKFSREYLPFIKKLKQLTPFPSIMTTNVDDCLAKTGQFDFEKIYYKISDMHIDLFHKWGIFHIHGYVEDSEGQLWSLLDYSKRYDCQEFKEFIRNTFREYSVLFLGYGFGDDNELQQLMAKAKIDNPAPRIHFALLPTDETYSHIDEAMYKEVFNIQIIKYGPKADFIKLFSEWIDSNFNPAMMGKDDEISQLPPITEGAWV